MTPNPLWLFGSALGIRPKRHSGGRSTPAILTATGKGVQIYGCQNAQWVFQIPEAILFDSAGQQIGTHGAGPVWTLSLRSGARNAANIPWLQMLKARQFRIHPGARTRAEAWLPRARNRGWGPEHCKESLLTVYTLHILHF